MFEDGAKLDDILNFFGKKPTLDEEENKNTRVLDEAFRYDTKQSVGEYNIRFDFAKNSGGLL